MIGAGSLKQINLAGIGMLVLLSIAGYLIGIEPVVQARVGQAGRNVALDEVTRESTMMEANLKSARATFADLRRRLDDLPYHLIPATEVNQRLLLLTKLAERFHLSVSAIAPGKSEPGPLFTIVPIQVSGQCTYNALTRFLNAVCAEFPDTSITDFKLSGTPHTQETEATFSLACAWYTAPASPTVSRTTP